MRPRTLLALGIVVLACAGVAAVTLVGGQETSGQLTEVWTSDTPRNNTVNHHAVGASGGILVAPLAAVPNSGTEITPRSCSLARLAAADGGVEWRATVPPQTCFTHALTQPAIADTDGDGDLEVVVGTTENATIVYDAATGTEAFRVPLSTYGYGQPTVADVTTATGPEIVTSDIRGTVVVARGTDGSVEWRADLEQTVWAKPVVADADADGAPEVVVGGHERTVAFEADGRRAWTVPTAGIGVEAGQVDDDPALELFVANDDGVRALDGATGDEEWRADRRGGLTLKSVGDGDGDGTAELYLSRPGNTVLALDGTTGDEEWTTRLAPDERTTTPPPVLGDLTGDGTPELVAVTSGGTVVVLDPATGSELAAYERSVPVWTFPTLADVTDAPGEEILLQYGDARVVALSYTES